MYRLSSSSASVPITCTCKISTTKSFSPRQILKSPSGNFYSFTGFLQQINLKNWTSGLGWEWNHCLILWLDTLASSPNTIFSRGAMLPRTDGFQSLSGPVWGKRITIRYQQSNDLPQFSNNQQLAACPPFFMCHHHLKLRELPSNKVTSRVFRWQN